MNKFALRILLTNTFLYMIKHLVLLTFICLLFACRSQEDKNSYANLIKGDWVDLQQDSGYTVNKPIAVSFIIHGNKTIHSAAYEHSREPMELNLLFGKLYNVYKHVNMQADSTLNDDYFFMNYNIMKELIPPPNIFLAPKIVPGKR